MADSAQHQTALLPKSTTEIDMINHPPHHERGGIETIDVIEAWELGFKLGNVIKYIHRRGWKGDEFLYDKEVEDLKKARWYLDRAIKVKEEFIEINSHTEASHLRSG